MNDLYNVNHDLIWHGPFKIEEVKKLIQRILDLGKISKELEPSELKRNRYLQQIQNYANSFINDIETSKAYSGKKVKRGALSVNGDKKTLRNRPRTGSVNQLFLVSG